MFDENFSFDAPRSPSTGSSTAATRDSSRAVSPCSPTTPFPPPRLSVTDLAAHFACQRIRTASQVCYDTCESYANTDGDEAGWSVPSTEVTDDNPSNRLSRSRTFPTRPHSPSRRAQRQLNTRLLCSTTHRGDIAALVARMVESKEQCSVSTSGSNSPSHEDEGYSSENNDNDREMSGTSTSRRSSVATVKYRRSSDYKGIGGACVSKNVRLRKREPTRRVRSAEDKR